VSLAIGGVTDGVCGDGALLGVRSHPSHASAARLGVRRRRLGVGVGIGGVVRAGVGLGGPLPGWWLVGRAVGAAA
jgi:hypothetical protein